MAPAPRPHLSGLAFAPRRRVKLETMRAIAREARSEVERPGDVKRRAAIVGLALAGMGAMTAVSLLQTGVVDRLPDPPGAFWDSARVNLSDEAFRFGIPDGLLALGSYALTIPLALAGGGADRAKKRPWWALALVAKAALDAAGAAKYTLVDMPRLGVACIYCITAAAASFTILGLALPEARAALSALRGASSGPSRPARRPG